MTTVETTTHDIKCWPMYFDAIRTGRKTFEVRLNDRNYHEGDTVLLREYDPEQQAFTGRTLLTQVGYLLPLDDRGAAGHVAFSLIFPTKSLDQNGRT